VVFHSEHPFFKFQVERSQVRVCYGCRPMAELSFGRCP
jgi:hypothetical protein